MDAMKKRTVSLILITTVVIGLQGGRIARGETIEELDQRASMYYEQKEFSKALADWLRILDIDQNNENAQKKIEMLYEEKHKKDLSYQRARAYFRRAAEQMGVNFALAKLSSEEAIKNFVSAYRVDPNDPDLQAMREDMRKLQEEVRIEEEKRRLSAENKKRFDDFMLLAEEYMKKQDFEPAVKAYKAALKLLPKDLKAAEGYRTAEMALNNRLKFEKIQTLLVAGLALFNEKKYKEARMEYEQIIALDEKNKDAARFMRKIDDILEEGRNLELKRAQSEQLYQRGIENVQKKNFDQAVDDFESVLSLIPGYKDVKDRLANMDRLRKEWAEEQKFQRLKDIDKEFQNGLFAYANRKFKDALSYFEKTLRLDPGNELAKKYIDLVKDALKDVEEETVDTDSPYYDIVNSLVVSGRRLFDQGDYPESRQRWEKILKLFPKNKIAFEFLLKCEFKMNPRRFGEIAGKYVDEGKDLMKENRFDKALANFEMVKSISPEYPQIDELIAASRRGNQERKVFGGGATADEIEGAYNEGMAYYQRGGEGNVKLAMEKFQWVVARDPNNVKALINLNKIASQLRVGGGVIAAEEGVALTERQRQLVRQYYYNGIAYYTSNNFDKAIEEWYKVLAIDPTHEKARNNIKKCLVLLGR
ncbi:MAG: hypothetical protein EPN93_15165 [Spirochaetes bacterium]|nr:MAG: hypothetical protein EPN93_15165 [Spirochaetota bacterium]